MHQTLSSVNVIESCDHNMHQTFSLCKGMYRFVLFCGQKIKEVLITALFFFSFFEAVKFVHFLFNVYLGA